MAPDRPESRSVLALAVLALLSGLCYALVAWIDQSLHVTSRDSQVLLIVLGIFAATFLLYLLALRVALRAPDGVPLLCWILGPAVVFRLLLLFTTPIEEIDLYRYLWDGTASVAGVSPYRFAPDQVLLATASDNLPDDLARLVAIRDHSPALQAILSRIHFADLPTIYPPVSQAVFAAAAWLVPRDASLAERMIVTKACFVLFDLGVIVVVAGLLRNLHMSLGWLLAYAWCPLVIKEIANSGHLDSVPAFLTVAFAYTAVLGMWSPREQWLKQAVLVLAAAGLLAMAVGAKLYPIILAPLFAVSLWRVRGWTTACAACAVFAITAACLLWPMFPKVDVQTTEGIAPWSVDAAELPPLPPLEMDEEARDPSQSVKAFLGQWEMNDFFFLLAMENLRPTAHLAAPDRAWFSVLPEPWRAAVIGPAAWALGLSPLQTAFITSRALLTVVFFGIVGWLCIRSFRFAEPRLFLEASFLIVAWFVLLSPTVNPWYWLWAVPFAPFGRNRTWLLLSGLLFVYYFRFWLVGHFAEHSVPYTDLRPELFFDYVVTWLEFAPWLVALALAARWRMRARRDVTFAA